MKWVNCKDAPPKIDSIVRHIGTTDTMTSGNFKDNIKKERINASDYQWLDESNTVDGPREGNLNEILKKAEKLFKGARQHDKDGNSELHWLNIDGLWEDLLGLIKETYNIGANSSQHPGGYLKVLEENFEATKRMPKSEYKNKLLETYEDLIAIYKAGFGQGEYSRAAIEASLTTSQHGGDTGKLVLWNGIEGEMEDVESLEHARQWLRENYADPEEGIHPDIELCEVYRLVATVAVVDGKQSGTSRIEVQPTQSTPTPPGIVEQLKRECPFTNYSEEEIIAWDKCCDTLATLLSVGEKGEEKKEDRS